MSVHLAAQLQRRHKIKIATLFFNRDNLPEISQRISYLLPPKILCKVFEKSRFLTYIFGSIHLFFMVLRQAKNIDILNPHNPPSLWVAALVNIFYKIPIIWFCNDVPGYVPWAVVKKSGFVDKGIWIIGRSFLNRWAVSKVFQIVVLDKKNQRIVSSFYGRNSIILNPGIDVDFYQPKRDISFRKKYNLGNSFILLCVGKLHHQKNQNLLILTLKRILSRIPQARLVFVGSGPKLKFLEEKAKKSRVEDKVIFTGNLSHELLLAAYHDCNLNIFPAFWQSWGLTPLEALCAGKLSLVSSESGVAEVFEKEKIGLIAMPSSKDFAQKILDFYRHPLKYQDMAKKGYKFIKISLSWQKYGEKSREIFESAFLDFYEKEKN